MEKAVKTIESTSNGWSEQFPVGHGGLETALRDAWDRTRRADNRSLYRGMTLNLVVVAPFSRAAAIATEIDSLLYRHPTRAFVFLLDDEATSPSTTVQLRVREEHSSRHLVLELIQTQLSPSGRGLLRSTVVPSLLNDLPTLLFWDADPSLVEPYRELAMIADQVVVDRTDFHGCAIPEQYTNHGTPVIDLAHFRLRPWRRALAEAFEQFRWQAQLGTQVVIRHLDVESAACAASMLAHWLQKKLNADITYEPAVSEGPDREPLHVELRNGDLAMVRVQHRGPEPHLHVEVTAATAHGVPFEVAASQRDRGDLLAAAADHCH